MSGEKVTCLGCRAKSHHPADDACEGCPCFNDGLREGVRRLDNLRREQRATTPTPVPSEVAETTAGGIVTPNPKKTCPVAKFGRPHVWGFGFWHEGEFIAEGYVKCVCGQIEED